MDAIESVLSDIVTGDGVITSPEELKKNQFGIPLRHLSQQYLFGATGLRVGVFYSISGNPGTGKSSLVFDLIGQVAADAEHGGVSGMGMIYDLEHKMNPTLLHSILARYGEQAKKHTAVAKGFTLEAALTHLSTKLLPSLAKAKDCIPTVIDIDTVGGAATNDVSAKIRSEGYLGKGLNEKPHIVKNFCENVGELVKNLPVVIFCVNQEKEKIATNPYAAKPKEMMAITGGVSQIYKDGWMGHAEYSKLPNGKLIRIRTIKTSFSDDRTVEVQFKWNATGDVDNLDEAYGHYMDWPLATATLLAVGPMGVVGQLRQICNVSLKGESVTCPTLGLESVSADVFEKALMENKEVYEKLLAYLKIDTLRPVSEMRGYIDETAAKSADEPKRTRVRVVRNASKQS